MRSNGVFFYHLLNTQGANPENFSNQVSVENPGEWNCLNFHKKWFYSQRRKLCRQMSVSGDFLLSVGSAVRKKWTLKISILNGCFLGPGLSTFRFNFVVVNLNVTVFVAHVWNRSLKSRWIKHTVYREGIQYFHKGFTSSFIFDVSYSMLILRDLLEIHPSWYLLNYCNHIKRSSVAFTSGALLFIVQIFQFIIVVQ